MMVRRTLATSNPVAHLCESVLLREAAAKGLIGGEGFTLGRGGNTSETTG